MKFLVLLAVFALFASTINACGNNEEFRECGTACEPTCQDPNPGICTLQCILNVCQCKHGYVRGSSGCVRFSQCSVYGK